jgi:DNA-directed RNA polymerase specialized sigma24 family protein
MFREFNADFLRLSRLPDVRSRTKGFINRYSKWLGNQIEVDDVLSEVYIRGLKTIKSGKPIHDLPAWVRTTSLNVVRELYRKAEKQHKLEKKVKQESPLGMDGSFEFSEFNESCDCDNLMIKEYLVRLQSLSPTEQKILGSPF